ncbi:MAG TPA: NIF family HAD-type phosphatase [Dehalococcoidia bacterium]|nr:NIF family HAD-type phosphatase [Dehalococcoidia bacterium]
MARRRKVVFDWYGTLGVSIPRDPAGRMLLRPHAEAVLRDLAAEYDLAIWTTAPADYMARAYRQFPVLGEVIGQLITREVAPIDDQTRITRGGVYDRFPRYSKNIALIGGDILIEDYPAAKEEHPEFPVIIVPSLEVAGPEDIARVEAEDRVLLALPPEIRRLLDSPHPS